MDDFKKSKEKILAKEESLEIFPSGSNRVVYSLVDRTKHNFILAVAIKLKDKIASSKINSSDKAKILSVRSDLITLEYALVIVDKVVPGVRLEIKKRLFSKLHEGSRQKIYTKDVGPRLAPKVVPADILVFLCEEQGIKDLSDVFSGKIGMEGESNVIGVGKNILSNQDVDRLFSIIKFHIKLSDDEIKLGLSRIILNLIGDLSNEELKKKTKYFPDDLRDAASNPDRFSLESMLSIIEDLSSVCYFGSGKNC